ncbi:hypothetical protein P3T29_005079 [Kitasatospora sp. MAP5-34]|nr:hypothetical protein [Kitasatospora sp. MAP5-34]
MGWRRRSPHGVRYRRSRYGRGRWPRVRRGPPPVLTCGTGRAVRIRPCAVMEAMRCAITARRARSCTGRGTSSSLSRATRARAETASSNHTRVPPVSSSFSAPCAAATRFTRSSPRPPSASSPASRCSGMPRPGSTTATRNLSVSATTSASTVSRACGSSLSVPWSTAFVTTSDTSRHTSSFSVSDSGMPDSCSSFTTRLRVAPTAKALEAVENFTMGMTVPPGRAGGSAWGFVPGKRPGRSR